MKDIKKLLKDFNCELVGIQEGFGNIPSQVLFNTTIDRSTLALPINTISAKTIKAKLLEHKNKLKGGK